eukprot:4704418-Ditylum_brightwellii.AAC.1
MKQSKADCDRYALLDKLEAWLVSGEDYTPFNVTDDVIGIIDTDSCPRAAACKKFVDSIGSSNFPMLVYKYRSPGQATNWVVVFKLPKNTKLKNLKVMERILKANDNAPQYLSC